MKRDDTTEFAHWRRVLLLLGGSGLGYLIVVASAPILSRLYGPNSFGLLAAVMSIASISAVIVHGRYHLGILLSASDANAVSLFRVATVLNIVLAPIVATVVALLALKEPFGDGGLIIGSAVVMTWLTAQIDIFTFWRSHRRRFRVSAAASVVRSGCATAAQVALSAFTAAGLIIGAVIGAVAVLLFSLRDLIANDRSLVADRSAPGFLSTVRRHFEYPKFSMPQGLVAALSRNLFPILLVRLAGTDPAGMYWLAYRLLLAPVAMFNGAYRQAILPILAARDEVNSRLGAETLRKHAAVLFLMCLIGAAILFLAGQPIFEIVFGERWRPAGDYAAWLALALTTDVAKVPAICLLQSRSLHAVIFKVECTIAVVRYGAVIPTLVYVDALTSLAVFSVIGFLSWGAFTIYFLGTPAIAVAASNSMEPPR